MKLTLEQARFVVRVMDSMTQYPSCLPAKLAKERKKIDVLYFKYGGWTEGYERGRAEWLISHLQNLNKKGKEKCQVRKKILK